MKESFGTGGIARICGVAPRTASKWIDSGLLPGRRIPGSKVRRVSRETLVTFLNEHGLPVPDELKPSAADAAV